MGGSEVGARAVYWAAHHRRREVYVGWPTVAAIAGNKLAPGVLDRYLGKTGFASQQTDEPEDPNRPDNLWKPVPGDHGAHGTFDSRAHKHSFEVWADLNRSWLGLGLALAGTAGLFLAARSSRPRNFAERGNRRKAA